MTTDNNASLVHCEKCGLPMEQMPYHDAAGCGTAVIALWRCANGHAVFGDVIDYAFCEPASEDE
ncbi:MAG: hypothetical protein Kow0077_27320 [Anaerolineae bacterium]